MRKRRFQRNRALLYQHDHLITQHIMLRYPRYLCLLFPSQTVWVSATTFHKAFLNNARELLMLPIRTTLFPHNILSRVPVGLDSQRRSWAPGLLLGIWSCWNSLTHGSSVRNVLRDLRRTLLKILIHRTGAKPGTLLFEQALRRWPSIHL